jgi:hypothetical protein
MPRSPLLLLLLLLRGPYRLILFTASVANIYLPRAVIDAITRLINQPINQAASF